MTRTSKLAYLAALLDAEGYIGMDDGIINELRECVRTGNTTRKVCKWLQLHFGGNFHRVPDKDGEKIYYWKLYGSQAVPKLLNELLPFLLHKFEDATDSLQRMHHTPDISLKNKAMNRREIAGYQAGFIDARGFEGKVPFEPEDSLEQFFLSILPYLVERKQKVNELLQAHRQRTATTITPDA